MHSGDHDCAVRILFVNSLCAFRECSSIYFFFLPGEYNRDLFSTIESLVPTYCTDTVSHILYRHSMQQNAGEEPGNVDHYASIVKLGMWLALVQALTCFQQLSWKHFDITHTGIYTILNKVTRELVGRCRKVCCLCKQFDSINEIKTRFLQGNMVPGN